MDGILHGNMPGAESREPVCYLVFAASLRTASLNAQLARLAAAVLEQHGGLVDRASMAEFDAPSYDQEQQDGNGFPPGAEELHRRLLANDALVIAAPEYNASMPGLLKNAIDWVSRYHPQPFNERHALLLSASPSMVGGNRGLWALRVPLEHLGARAFPAMFSLAQAHQAFTADWGSPTSTSARASSAPSWRLWTSLRRRSTIRAPRKPGSSTLGNRPPGSRGARNRSQLHRQQAAVRSSETQCQAPSPATISIAPNARNDTL